MQTRELEELQTRINGLKTKCAKLEGSLETIKAKWAKEHGTEDVAKVQELMKGMEAELAEVTREYDALLSDLRTLLLAPGV